MTQRWAWSLGAVGWFVMAGAALAADVSLTISIPSPVAEGGTASTQLRMGTAPGATTGFDTRWDVPAPPTPSENVVTLAASIAPPPSVGAQQLLWDFRDETLPQSWTVNVTTDQPESVTLGWTATGSGNACSPMTWSMEDLYSGTRMVLDAASREYQYSAPGPRTREFRITAAAAPAPPIPWSPANLWSPRQGRASVYLAWAPSQESSITYHVYRETDQGATRLTPSPIAATAYVDKGIDLTKPVTYYVTAVTTTGCESPRSNGYRLTPRR
ncbi:MAG: hypothetical protein ACOYXU_05485 [Nitrospirota bacterium]